MINGGRSLRFRCRKLTPSATHPGGTVRPPGSPNQRLDIHFGRGAVPACLAETIIIALEGCPERRTLGDNYRVEVHGTLPNDALLLGFFPHMHLRGKKFEYNIVHDDGGRETLLRGSDLSESDDPWIRDD